MFKDLLQSQHRLIDFSYVHGVPCCEIFDEGSLDIFLGQWTWNAVSEALEKAQKNGDPGSSREYSYMVSGGQAWFLKLALSRESEEAKGLEDKYTQDIPDMNIGDTRDHRPDWGGVRRPVQCAGKQRNILPGETKLSSKWDRDKLPSGYDEHYSIAYRFYGPIQQIYTYCMRSNSRYGYLITDKELLVIRVCFVAPEASSQASFDDSQNSNNSRPHRKSRPGGLQFRLIPWDNIRESTTKDGEGLTVNFGLWCLYMLAARGTDI
ncbi:MAG: hypothetical protein Q9202_005827 [Teloschistes flavicans]